jgi:predicted RecB family nuclease
MNQSLRKRTILLASPMLNVSGAIKLSASDLVGHLNCRHLTGLDLAVVNGQLAKPQIWDPLIEVLAERGALHEQAYVDYLKAAGHQVTVIDGTGVDAKSVSQTSDLMKAGAEIIAQGALEANGWNGRADILRRIDVPSQFGAWSYEVVDTKLARETKGGTVLQLCLYSDLLSSAQGSRPEFAYVVTPWSDFQPQQFRLLDYAAYYRRVKASLENSVTIGADESTYPDPKAHCEICRWRVRCDVKRHDDDHLSLVAGIAKSHINELKQRGIGTTAQLAAVPLPLSWKPDRGAVQTYERIREQARIQIRGRAEGCVVHETLPIIAGFGLTRLPPPSSGDIFLDLEGDPFVGDGGLEFLFGYAFEDDKQKSYVAQWSFSRTEEKSAFEGFADFVTERLNRYPDMHIYHFAPYEPAALKRLMGRYATREEEIDRMLRSKLFIDLYAVVRHAIRASVESYSIKKLEPLYTYVRQIALPDANRVLAKVQACLELSDVENISDQDRSVVEGYNRDDCLSTQQLRDWLEIRRAELIAQGVSIDRPLPETGDASEDVSEWQQKIALLVGRLTENIPVDAAERDAQQHARWLLAYVLDFHRRENKAIWWEYFRLRDLSAEDLLEERAGLAGLKFLEAVGGTAKAPIHRYSFLPQETELRGGEELRSLGGEKFGKVEEISLEDRWIDIKKRKDTADLHPEAVFEHEVIRTNVLADALVRIGEYVAEHGIAGAGPYRAARDLLMMAAPRLSGQELKGASETAVTAAIRIAPHLDGGVLPIQGPPGAGKTYTGARMICTITQLGRKTGVTANSHKVIRNLLDDVLKAANEAELDVQCIQKVSESEDDLPSLRFTESNEDLLDAIGTTSQVAGGTAWLWARPDAFERLDALFIDEAAQMSLANVLAVSQAAKNVVLLGDPQQLEQPMQGSHPEGTGVSALDHILAGHATIPPDRGLFLEETWRLHPDICAFTSELFYEDRLHARPGLEQQEIKSTGRIQGTGLRFLPVIHEGNQSSSPEEADQIRDLVADILASQPSWIDREGVEKALTLEDILIIAPYNNQVFELQDRIKGARIGTVDKFQGQQAPIVIYSVTTSSHADAPRGMEFLYSSNRLNVATSRARCVCVLVGSPQVFEAECRTPRHMQLANAFCRYREMAAGI